MIKKLSLPLFMIALSAAPTPSLAVLKGNPIAPKGGVASVFSKKPSEAHSFFDTFIRHELIGLTSEEYKYIQEEDQDRFHLLINQRADELCQLKHYQGAAVTPPFKEKIGSLTAYDLDSDHSDLVQRQFDSTQGKTYQLLLSKGAKNITKSEFLTLKAKSPRAARAVQEKTGPIPTIVFTDLQCSHSNSLTGVSSQSSAAPAPSKDQSTSALRKAERAHQKKLNEFEALFSKLIDLFKTIDPQYLQKSRHFLAIASTRKTKPLSIKSFSSSPSSTSNSSRSSGSARSGDTNDENTIYSPLHDHS